MTEYKITLLVEQVNPPRGIPTPPTAGNFYPKPTFEDVDPTELLGVEFTETSLQDAVRKIAAHAGVLLTESHEQVVANVSERAMRAERLLGAQRELTERLDAALKQSMGQREAKDAEIRHLVSVGELKSTRIDELTAELKAARAATRAAKATTRRGVN